VALRIPPYRPLHMPRGSAILFQLYMRINSSVSMIRNSAVRSTPAAASVEDGDPEAVLPAEIAQPQRADHIPLGDTVLDQGLRLASDVTSTPRFRRPGGVQEVSSSASVTRSGCPGCTPCEIEGQFLFREEARPALGRCLVVRSGRRR